MGVISIIFESGKLAEVRVTLYKAPGDRSRLLDAYVTTECEGAVTRSARRAAEAVLGWLPEKYRPKEPMVAGFDLSGLSTDQTITGESGGLALAIALAAELTGKDPGHLAATGILANSSAKSSLMPVKGISTKINGAIEVLPAESRIFFPQANEDECDGRTKIAAQKKGMVLQGASSLCQTLNTIFDVEVSPIANVTTNKNKSSMVGATIITALIIVLSGFIALRGNGSPAPAATTSHAPVKATQTDARPNRISHIEGPVTLWFATPEEQAMAPVLSKKLSEHLDTLDVFIATLTIRKPTLPQGMNTVEATLSNVSLKKDGIEKSVQIEPVTIADSGKQNHFNSLLIDLLVTNFIKALPEDAQETNNVRSLSIPAGKGFD